MTDIIIHRRDFNGDNLFINGKETILPRDEVFQVDDSVINVLDRAHVPYEPAPATGSLTGKVIIDDLGPFGARMPITVNGKSSYLPTGKALSLTDAQIEVLEHARIPFIFERSFALSMMPQPAQSSLAFSFHSSDLGGSFGTKVSSWTDRIAGLSMTQTDPTYQPTLVASLNGFPGIEFTSPNTLIFGRPTQLINLLNATQTTQGGTLIFIVDMGTSAPTGHLRSLWSPSNALGGKRNVNISADYCGGQGNARNWANQSNLQVIVVRESLICTNGDGQFFQNGNAYPAADMSPDPSNNYAIGGPGQPPFNNSYGFSGRVLEVHGHTEDLSNAQIFQYIRYACDKYGVDYPWAGLSHYFMLTGDSQSSAVATTDWLNTWGNLLANSRGIPIGGWTNMAVPSRMSYPATPPPYGMYHSAPKNITGLREMLGIPLILNVFEYYNQAEANAAGLIAYLNQARTLDPLMKIIACTCIDNGDQVGTAKKDNMVPFINSLIASPASYDVLCRLDQDPTIGLGQCPVPPAAESPLWDSLRVHLTDQGQPYMVPLVSAALDAAIAKI